LLKYLDTDLTCYLTDHPPALQEAQDTVWKPYRTWFEGFFKTRLKTTTGLAALTQSDETHEAVANYVGALDDAKFTALQLIASLAGSLILALHALENETSADDIFAAIRIEENFKAEIYNEDFYGQDPAQEEKDKAIKAELETAIAYLKML